MQNKIGLGGSCHWCTEAIFQTLRGVHRVEQGWISAKEEKAFSEAVIVHFDPGIIDPAIIIEVHLRTHSCTSAHSLRGKYRSAIYVYTDDEAKKYQKIIDALQAGFDQKIITKVLHFEAFQLNQEKYLNYYKNNPDKPFCKNRIDPKLNQLRKEYGAFLQNE